MVIIEKSVKLCDTSPRTPLLSLRGKGKRGYAGPTPRKCRWHWRGLPSGQRPRRSCTAGCAQSSSLRHPGHPPRLALHCYYTNMLWSDASQVILLANFVFFLCVKFHKSLFWVPILAAGGPYWVPISQKVGSLFQSLGVPISLCDSENAKKVPIWTQSL